MILNSPFMFGSSWTPAELPGLLVWHDAADDSTFSLSGSNVTQWRDKSPNGNHLSVSGSITRAAGTLNGKPTVVHAANSYTQWATRMTTVRGIWVVHKWLNTSGDYRSLLWDDSGYPLHGDTAASGKLIADFVWSEVIDADKWVNGAQAAAGDRLARYTNWTRLGMNVARDLPMKNMASQPSYSGARNFIGSVAEIIFTSGTLSASDRGKLESYLSNKWGI